MSRILIARVLLGMLAMPATLPILAQDREFAIVNIDVVPMDSEQVLEDQTVIVRDGVITSVSATAATTLMADAIMIDGEGKFLMPGLADLHVHLRNGDELLNYVAWGVTTVMHMGGTGQSGAQQLEYRSEIRAGERIGPNVYTTDRILDGDPRIASGAHSVSTEADARIHVRNLRDGGFDFVKIYNNVSRPVFYAIVDEADQQGLSVIGHIPRNFDPLDALTNGQDAIAHVEELFFTYFEGPRSTETLPNSFQADMSKLPALVNVLRSNEVAVMPDLCFSFGNLMMWNSLDHIWQDPEFKYLHPTTGAMWRSGNINRRQEIENFIVREQWKYTLMQQLTVEFERAGILQVIGTDAALPGLYPGKAAHSELTELVKAGLSNFQALAIGTRNAGEFARRYLGEDARFGQVLPGYRADLVILDKNPLEDIRNARSISAVVVNGRIVDRTELDQHRAQMKARYDALNEAGAHVNAALAQDDFRAAIESLVEENSGNSDMLVEIEARVNAAGYLAVADNDFGRANEILELNTRLFPDSANVWDSFAEVTNRSGDRQRAIELYRKALQADPEFDNAQRQLERLIGAGNE